MEKVIWLKPSCFLPGIGMTITVPDGVDPDEYIDSYLEAILNDDILLNVEWDYYTGHP
ncbi:MAG: hypothetical protein KH138_03625 [Firmicutes bacterium]|nr:hypothetical protein [Bacillota bacterium]